jgi:hypothetical protein
MPPQVKCSERKGARQGRKLQTSMSQRSACKGCTKQGTNPRKQGPWEDASNLHGSGLKPQGEDASNLHGERPGQTWKGASNLHVTRSEDASNLHGKGQARHGRELQTFMSHACMLWLHKHNGPKPMGGRFKPPWMWSRVPVGGCFKPPLGTLPSPETLSQTQRCRVGHRGAAGCITTPWRPPMAAPSFQVAVHQVRELQPAAVLSYGLKGHSVSQQAAHPGIDGCQDCPPVAGPPPLRLARPVSGSGARC